MTRCYFDTDAFRHVGTAFRDQELAAALRKRIVVSPITALEVMSQLVTAGRVEVHAQIQAMRNWLPHPAPLLPMPTSAIADRAFGKDIPDKMYASISHSLDACLQIGDVNELVQDAGRLRDYLDKWKGKEAWILTQYQKASLADIQAGYGPPDRNRLVNAIREGLAKRVDVSPLAPLTYGLRRLFSAFFEYEEERALLIGADRHYNPANARNINDAFDSEQLLYLTNPDLRFITCDRKYSRRVTRCRQAGQIVTADAADLQDTAGATQLITRITA
jgi:hypothetical protein